MQGVTELPAHRGLNCGLRGRILRRARRPRRAILAYSLNRAKGVPVHRGLNCDLRGRTAQRGETPAVSPLLRITPFPFRTRCARKGVVPPCGCHPLALAIWRGMGATPEWGRPLCSDFWEGCCHPGGAVRLRGVLRLVGREKVNWAEGPREAGLGHDSARHPCVFAPSGERASARSFVAALLRMTGGAGAAE